MRTLNVNTQKPYDILIDSNILKNSGEYIKSVAKPNKIAIITDDIVNSLYSNVCEVSFEDAGFEVVKFVFENGENSKNHDTVLKIYSFLSENGITRSDMLVAIGGGVVGDITGFVAATYLRGLDFVQIPTTFLAMIDSSVGGKTGVNIDCGKNLVGAFLQPRLVICDVNCLNTLTDEIFSDGMAEAIKYGCIWDKNLFEALKSSDVKDNIADIIFTCLDIKRQVVVDDTFDKGIRQILNFGHTLGHAIEKQSGYKVSHGAAVAIGMVLMTEFSESLSLTKPKTSNEIIEINKKYNLPTTYPVPMKELFKLATSDKKRDGDFINLVMISEIGKAFLHKVNITKII